MMYGDFIDTSSLEEAYQNLILWEKTVNHNKTWHLITAFATDDPNRTHVEVDEQPFAEVYYNDER